MAVEAADGLLAVASAAVVQLVVGSAAEPWGATAAGIMEDSGAVITEVGASGLALVIPTMATDIHTMAVTDMIRMPTVTIRTRTAVTTQLRRRQ